MDFKTLKTLIAFNLDDPKNEYYSQENLRLFINQAYQDLYSELIKRNIFTKVATQTVTFTSGSPTTLLTTKPIPRKIVAVFDSDNNIIPIYNDVYGKRSRVRSVSIKSTLTRGIRSLLLRWFETPSSTFDITVEYAEAVNQFSESAKDSDSFEDIPLEHHNVIILWATILAVGKDGENFDTFTSLYQKAFDTMIEDLQGGLEESAEVVDYVYPNN